MGQGLQPRLSLSMGIRITSAGDGGLFGLTGKMQNGL